MRRVPSTRRVTMPASRSTLRWRDTAGADTPVPAVVTAAHAAKADAVVLAATRSTAFTAHASSLRKLAGDRPVYLAGRGADAQTVAEVGATALPNDPVRAVVFLVGALNELSGSW